MKYALLVLALCTPVQAQVSAREQRSCDKNLRIEHTILSTTSASPLFGAALTANQISLSSGTFLASRSWVGFLNKDATATNEVWLSTFAVTALVSGVLDTSKSFPIATTAVLPYGANIKLWAHRVIASTAVLIGWACE